MKARNPMAYCWQCQQTFPRSWFTTRDATSKNGRDFCSQKCSDKYQPETMVHRLFHQAALT